MLIKLQKEIKRNKKTNLEYFFSSVVPEKTGCRTEVSLDAENYSS